MNQMGNFRVIRGREGLQLLRSAALDAAAYKQYKLIIASISVMRLSSAVVIALFAERPMSRERALASRVRFRRNGSERGAGNARDWAKIVDARAPRPPAIDWQ
ncbi:unnamed protein product, partial [Iphiclides podalirius]